MSFRILKIGTVDTEDGRGNPTPFGRVNIVDQETKKRSWHFFKSLDEFDEFADLWMKLQSPWLLRYEDGRWSTHN